MTELASSSAMSTRRSASRPMLRANLSHRETGLVDTTSFVASESVHPGPASLRSIAVDRSACCATSKISQKNSARLQGGKGYLRIEHPIIGPGDFENQR